MIKKIACITGICGQSASYLAEILLENNYTVYGLFRRTTSPNFQNISHLLNNPNLELVQCDITDAGAISSCLSKIQPDEIYNLAAMSFVKYSFDSPIHTFDVDTTGVLNILEWVRQHSKETKLYQASTSEMFGKSFSRKTTEWDERNEPCNSVKYQNEDTPYIPQSPYAIAKLAAHHLCRLYREAYGLYVVSNITFNHESPRRGKEFVTRKITDYIGRLINSNNRAAFPKLQLGNIYSSRDWGHARDYMEAAYSAMQQDAGDNYVVCTGETHTVEQFLEEAFGHVGLKWQDYVEISKEHMRPAEVDFLCGDNSRAKKKLNWKPKTSFKELVKEMVDNDILLNCGK